MTENRKKHYIPLKTTKKLRSTMQRHYFLAKYRRFWKGPVRRPTAWVTSGAPVEILRAFGIFTVYPENYGAVCGTARVSTELCREAEAKGYSQDLCSYARSNIGSITRGDIAPGGGLPTPDLIVTCNNICGTVLKWYEALARIFNVPILMLDTPFINGEIEEHHVAYVYNQLKNMVANLESFTGKDFNEKRLEYHLALSAETIDLWKEIREMCKNKPSPLNIPDLFLHLAPIVSLRGTKEARQYYDCLRTEVRERAEQGLSAINGEKYRLLWDNIAIWYNIFKFFRVFSEHNACFVTDTYTGGWAMDISPGNSLESLAWTYTSIFLNRSLDFRADQMIKLIRDFEVDGFVMHSNRSCKPYSLVQEAIRRQVTAKTGKPGILIEADMADSRAFSEEQTRTRVQAFLETLQIP